MYYTDKYDNFSMNKWQIRFFDIKYDDAPAFCILDGVGQVVPPQIGAVAYVPNIEDAYIVKNISYNYDSYSSDVQIDVFVEYFPDYDPFKS